MSIKNRLLIFDPSSWMEGTGGTSYLRNVGNGMLKYKDAFDITFFCNSAARHIIGEHLEPNYNVLYSPQQSTGIAGAKARSKLLQYAVNSLAPHVVVSMNQCDACLEIPILTFFRNRLYFDRNTPWFKKATGVSQKLKYYLLYLKTLKSIRRSNYLLFPTTDFGKQVELQLQHGKQWSSVHFGLNVETVQNHPFQKDHSVVNILSLHYNIHKNYKIIWMALNKIWRNGGERIKWTILDDLERSPYPCGRKLFKEIELSPYRSRIKFVGRIPQSEMRRVYSNADLFLYPTLCESFGHGLVEALGNGLPSVVSDIGVNRELACDSVVYADCFNVDDWASSIDKILTDNSFAERLQQKALNRAKKFSWDNHSKNLLKCVQTVLSDA